MFSSGLCCLPVGGVHVKMLKCCNLIGLQNSCSGTNPGIVMSPNLPLFRMEVGLRPTRYTRTPFPPKVMECRDKQGMFCSCTFWSFDQWTLGHHLLDKDRSSLRSATTSSSSNKYQTMPCAWPPTVHILYWWPYWCPVQLQHASVCRWSPV